MNVWVIGGGGVAFLATLFLVIEVLPQRLIDRRMAAITRDGRASSVTAQVDKFDRITKENEVRTGLLQVLGTVVLALGLLITFMQVRVTQQGSQEQISLSREEQASERFSRAVEQLSDRTLGVRLGGIYALQEMVQGCGANAGDLDEGTCQYYVAVTEVLTGYVRSSAPRRRDKDGEFLGSEPGVRPTTMVEERPDLHAALNVLGNSALSEMSLSATDLRGLSLNSASNYYGTDFRNADLSYGILDGIVLADSDFTDADLWGARLKDVDLTGAVLDGATLVQADLTGADLRRASLKNAYLFGATMAGADVRGVDLSRTFGLTAEDYRSLRVNKETRPPTDLA